MSEGQGTAVGVVAVGDELLVGAHPALNSPYIAQRMIEFGRKVRRGVVVGDDEAAIADAVGGLAETCGLVFVTGGLGPTLDDVTRHGVAAALGVGLVEDAGALQEVREWFERAGREMLESNRRQALVAEGAERVPNAFGTAMGALFVGILLQGLTMMNAPYYTQDFIKGAVLVVALVFTFSLSARRAGGH